MELPYLQDPGNRTNRQIIHFGGLNLGEGAQDGELTDCMGVSPRKFPALCQRKRRSRMLELEGITDLYAKDKLCMVAGTDFYYDGVWQGEVAAGKKIMATIGNTIVIFPDKLYFKTDTETFGSLEATVTAPEGSVVFTERTLTMTDISVPFQAGDAVEITGCTSFPENNKTPIIQSVNGSELTFLANTFTAGTEEGAVTLARKVPDLTCICQSSNRLWGCEGNTIYASKLGDPFNFYCYEGLTTDSYAVPVGTAGTFTACYPFGTSVLFFKEDCIHKMYGSKPANYNLVTSQVSGVAEGCAESVCAINETLYYLGRGGVYAYNGGVPELVSEKLGRGGWREGLACTDGQLYHLSAVHEGVEAYYLYDPSKGIWTQEADRTVDALAAWGSSVWFAMGGVLWAVDPPEGDGEDEGDVNWTVTFCPFREAIENRKCYSRLVLRVDMEEGAWLRAEVSCDGEPFQQVFLSDRTKQGTMVVPVRPQRCDRFAVRLSGEGGFILLSMLREMKIGSVI